MKLGIGTYTYMWSIGFDGAVPAHPMRALDLIDKARDLDIHVVQFGPNLPLNELPEPELQEILSACRAGQIEVEIGTRGIEAGPITRMIEFAARCGVSLLRIVPEIQGRVPHGAELLSSLRAIEPIAREAGVCCALENGLIPARELDRALQTLSSKWIGITLDTVNSLAIPEGTEEVVSRLGRWTRCLHVKDFTVIRDWHRMGFRVEGRPAGSGQLHIPWLMEQLAGTNCNAILELWPPPISTLEETIATEHQWAEESVRYLKSLMTE